MNQQNIHPSNHDGTAIEAATDCTPMPHNLSWTARYTANTMVEQAMLDAGRNKLSAQLAKNSMENIATLAMTAEQLSNMNPDATRCYQAIITMYAKNALTRLERW